MLKIIALDLEGTLISNAMSQIPRPGLYTFLVGCKAITPRVIMYTTVKEDQFRDIAKLLVEEGSVPGWFEQIEYVNWEGETKDLHQIPGNTNIGSSVLVDDYYEYVHEDQDALWLEIMQFAHPYPDSDSELDLTLNKLKARHSYEHSS